MTHKLTWLVTCYIIMLLFGITCGKQVWFILPLKIVTALQPWIHRIRYLVHLSHVLLLSYCFFLLFQLLFFSETLNYACLDNYDNHLITLLTFNGTTYHNVAYVKLYKIKTFSCDSSTLYPLVVFHFLLGKLPSIFCSALAY